MADEAMERYASGEDAAFAVVYDEVAPRLYAFLVRQTRSASQAEDLLQQTLLHVHRARGSFHAGAAVVPWAFAIARRLVIDGHRRGRRELLADDLATVPEPATGGPSAESLASARELAEQVDRALAELPSNQREAFQLVKQEGLSLAEAAAVLGTTVTAVKLRAHRAYQALRAVLGEHAPGREGGEP